MVAQTHLSIAPHGDEDSAKRHQIMDGARRVFMDLGFDGASMNEIARAAGVSKGTLYVYFTDKNRLFEAIVEQESLDHGKKAFNFDPALMPKPACVHSAVPISKSSAVRTAARPSEPSWRSLSGCRTSADGFMTVSSHTPCACSGIIWTRASRRKVAIGDCYLAAAQFVMMCQATLFQPYVFQVKPAPTKEQIATVVDSATRLFLAGYRAPIS